MITAFKTDWGRYVCSERDSMEVIGDRTAIGGWEEYTAEPQGPGIVAFKTFHGTYLCCHPDGTLVHRHPNYNPGDPPGPWEIFRTVHIDGNKVALQTAFGTFLVAEHPNTGGIKPYTIRHRHPHNDPDSEPGAWETFEVEPWWHGEPIPIPGDHPDPLVGTVFLSNGGRAGLQDDTGQRLVWGVHAGDLISRLYHGGEATVDSSLAQVAAAGGHFVRTWTDLFGSFWAARTGEVHADMPGYWDVVRNFARKVRANKLQWLVSQGDLLRHYRDQNDRRNFMDRLGRLLNEEGGTHLVIGVDSCNEASNNAGVTDPRVMADVLRPFLAHVNPALISTTSANEEFLNAFVSDVCTVCDSHHGRWHYRMAVERAWSAGWWGGKFRPHIVSSEPVGVGCQEFAGDNRIGHHISATSNPHDWNDLQSMGNLAMAHFTSNQTYVYMSSPGVISDEPFSNYPALSLTGWLARRLPRNLQAWRFFHGGDDKPWSPDRVLGVPVDNEARAEHCTDGGNYVVWCHGSAKDHAFRAINGFEGVRINLETREETPASWSRGEIVRVGFRRGTAFVGVRR